MTHLPYPDKSFDTVTFIANFNHIPAPLRDAEVSEAYRVLRDGGKVVVTMGNPLAELTIHRLVHAYDHFFGTNLDMDNERGMEEDEEYFVRDVVIIEHLAAAGFRGVQKRSFVTQWGLNHLLTALRPA
jgi:ubiquinone/menaquinone biosynthesis C-methylase UbiE